MDITIKPLAENDELAPVLAKWLFDEFARPTESQEFFSSMLTCPPGADGLPQAFVACAGEEPAGTVLLQRADLLSRQDIWPWLAFIYVRPEYRGLHIGAKLQQALCEHASGLGFDRVYLYTDLINYYEKTGWIYSGSCTECDGTRKQLFFKEINHEQL